MAQTQPAAMAKWRGRHYAARARATAASQQQQQRQQSSDAAATTTSASASAKASEPATIQTKNESLARRLHSSRFHNPRFHRSNGSGSVKSSSSSSNNNNENNNENNNDNDNHQNTNNNNNNNNKPAGNASSHRPATNHRSASDRDPSTLVSMVNPKNSREMELVRGISDRLETGLNGDALSAILDLLKRGEHPESIVAVVSSLAQRPR